MLLSGFFESAERPGEILRGFRVEIVGGAKVLLAVVLCCCGSRAGAALSTISEMVSLAPEPSVFTGAPVTFQKFDPSLGKLSSIEVIVQGTGNLTQRYENISKHSTSVQFHQTVEWLLTLPNGRPLLDVRQKEKQKYQTDSFDEVVDFDGTSGSTSVYDVTAEKEKMLTAQNRLSLFTGSGLADLFLSTGTSFNGTHLDGRVIREAQALAGADITIIYNYVAVPESDGFGVAAGMLGLIAAGATALRARKSFWGYGQ